MSTSEVLLSRLEELHPKKIDLSLGRIIDLCEKLGRPQDKLPPVIHVAGTNGKGSVIAFIEAMLVAAGKRVHVFTSPHLVDFHERIRLSNPDGSIEKISEPHLIDILTRAEKANAGVPITFFEITTAAAFLAFSEHPADYLILETGLGGRLDATNIVEQPALTVLTSISIDHTAFLGETVSLIASEKAGILKTGVTNIVAPVPEDAYVEIESRANTVKAPLYAAGRDWNCFEQHHRLVFQDEENFLDLSLPSLFGRHQINNAGTAIAAIRSLPDLDITPDQIDEGLTAARWPGRMERLSIGGLHQIVGEQNEIWLDGGHNPDAARVLAETMAELEERVPRPLHLICGMMNNKDALAFFETFKDLAEFIYTVPIPDQENGFTAEELANEAQKAGLQANTAQSVQDALEQSRSFSTEPTRILICGSLYLIGTIYALHASEAAAQ